MLIHPSPFPPPSPSQLCGWCGRLRPHGCGPGASPPDVLQTGSDWQCWHPWPALGVQWDLLPFPDSISLLGRHLPRHTHCCDVMWPSTELGEQSKSLARCFLLLRKGEKEWVSHQSTTAVQASTSWAHAFSSSFTAHENAQDANLKYLEY